MYQNIQGNCRRTKSATILLLKPIFNIKNHLQLRDPKNDFIFNFNFDDKMKIFEQFEFGTK